MKEAARQSLKHGTRDRGFHLKIADPWSKNGGKRRANHLYPVYLTETYIKSKYRSTAHFINLF